MNEDQILHPSFQLLIKNSNGKSGNRKLYVGIAFVLLLFTTISIGVTLKFLFDENIITNAKEISNITEIFVGDDDFHNQVPSNDFYQEGPIYSSVGTILKPGAVQNNTDAISNDDIVFAMVSHSSSPSTISSKILKTTTEMYQDASKGVGSNTLPGCNHSSTNFICVNSVKTSIYCNDIQNDESANILVLLGGKITKSKFDTSVEVFGVDYCPRFPKVSYKFPQLPQAGFRSGYVKKGQQILHLGEDGSIFMCEQQKYQYYGKSSSKWYGTISCSRYDQTIRRWRAAKVDGLKDVRLLEDFYGLSVKNYFIIGLRNNMHKIYDDTTQKMFTFNGSLNFLNTLGSCYVTINATRFVQIGGYRSHTVRNEVFLYDIEIERNGPVNDTYTPQPNTRVKKTRLPDLSFPRKYLGCGLAKMDGKIAIVIAGGNDNSNKKLKTVEYLPFQSETLDGIRGFQSINSSNWKSLPDLIAERSQQPSVGIVGDKLVVAGGACGSKYRNVCPLIEEFDVISNKWFLSYTMKLKHIRYAHNTFQVTRRFCDVNQC